MARLSCQCLAVVFLLLVVICGTSAAKERLVSVILVKNQPRYAKVHKEFLSQFKQKTHLQDRVYVQTPNADYMSLRNSVRKAVALGSDLIITYGASATLAAQAETSKVPVLFADVYDPASFGLVSADNGPTRNTLGVRGDGPIQTLVKLLLDTTQGKRLGVLYNPEDAAGAAQARAIESMAARRDFQAISLTVGKSGEINSVIKQQPAGMDALIVTDSLLLSRHLSQIIDLAVEQGVPAAAQIPGFADLGGFIALENDPIEQGEQLANLARKVLAGEDLDRLRMVKPHNISLIINLKVANSLNISVPFDVLSMTTRVVR